MFVKFERSAGNSTLEPIWINSNNVLSIEDVSCAVKRKTLVSTGGKVADGLSVIIVDGSVDETLAKLSQGNKMKKLYTKRR